MTWQDLVLMVGNVIFTISLIPTIKENRKLKRCDIPYSTSIVTGSVVFIFSITFATLRLWFSSLSAFVVAIAWGIIALQRWKGSD